MLQGAFINKPPSLNSSFHTHLGIPIQGALKKGPTQMHNIPLFGGAFELPISTTIMACWGGPKGPPGAPPRGPKMARKWAQKVASNWPHFWPILGGTPPRPPFWGVPGPRGGSRGGPGGPRGGALGRPLARGPASPRGGFGRAEKGLMADGPRGVKNQTKKYPYFYLSSCLGLEDFAKNSLGHYYPRIP